MNAAANTRFIPAALVALLALLGSARTAQAYTAVTLSNASGFTNDTIDTLLKTTGVGADHHAYQPATSLGMLLGLDVGIDATYLPFPSAFSSALSAASGQSTDQLPSGLFIPKLNVHKGLPFGIDIGGSFMTVSNSGNKVFSSYAGEAKYAVIENAALPTIAVRASYAVNSVYFMDAKTFDFDVVASKNLILIDPYVGMGIQHWSGTVNVPAGLSLPSGVSADGSGTPFHIYGGVQLKLAILHITGEADYSTTGLVTFGGKLSIGF